MRACSPKATEIIEINILNLLFLRGDLCVGSNFAGIIFRFVIRLGHPHITATRRIAKQQFLDGNIGIDFFQHLLELVS